MSIGIEVSPADPGPEAPSGSSGLRVGGLLALAAGMVIFAGALICVSEGMRYVIETNGGYCASGGPYEIAAGHECDGGAVGLLVGGIFAMLLGGAIALAGSGAYLGVRGFGLTGLLWAALFGLLGWNFIEFGLNPPANFANEPPIWGLLIPGAIFWLMAAPGLLAPVLALRSRREDTRITADPARPKLVLAKVPGAEEQPVAQPVGRDETPSPVLPWLLAVVAGSVAGVLAGFALAGAVL